jgi:NADH-quinone oxidoreductase subunit J
VTLELVFFGAIAVFTLYTAYFVVTAHNLFRSALGLTSVLIGVAGLYLLMDAAFLSAIQIAVYLGGIVVIVVFAILMIADVTQREFLTARPARSAGAMAAGGLFFGLIAWAMRVQGFGAGPRPDPAAADVAVIGRALVNPGAGGFALPFEVISLVLLAALLGAITVAGGRADGDGEGES